MFDLGFEPQIEKILENVKKNRQTVLTSATFPRNIKQLAVKMLRNPLEIVVGSRGQICRSVSQSIEFRTQETKFLRTLELLGQWTLKGNVIIFVEKQEEAEKLYQQLSDYHYKPHLMHGGRDQVDRNETFFTFKEQTSNVLVATSLMGRGLDIPNVVLVLNYTSPTFKEDYIHRIGRTGRAGQKGTAITFMS